MSGPPQTFGEAKLLAEKILRSETTIAGIDELGQSSGSVLSSEQVAALSAASIDVAFIPAEQAILVADALLADPRKTLGPPSDKSQDYSKSIDVPGHARLARRGGRQSKDIATSRGGVWTPLAVCNICWGGGLADPLAAVTIYINICIT